MFVNAYVCVIMNAHICMIMNAHVCVIMNAYVLLYNYYNFDSSSIVL